MTHPISRRKFLAGSSALLAALAGGLPVRGNEEQISILTRKIPSTGESIPMVGLGTWQTFSPDELNHESLKPLEAVLRLFFETGGRLIDTASMYGRAEEVTGILSDRLKVNDKLFIATKVWAGGKEIGIKQMEKSLRLLKRDKLDLMQIHNLSDWQTQLETIRAWKGEGKFRYAGVTHHDPARFDDLENILRTEKLDFIQLPYSIARREAEQRLLPAARDTNTAVLVMRPFEGGNLFNKTRNRPLPDFAQAWAQNWAEAFLKFILANEAVTCVIPATSKVDHLQDNMSAGIGRLPDEKERAKVVELLGL